MCQACGCSEYIKQGKDVALKRAVDIVKRLGVTPENARLFEDGETICGILGPRLPVSSSEAVEIWDIVQTVHAFHEGLHQDKRRKALEAAKDIFNHFPAKGNPKETLILWQQLESLHHDLDDNMIDSQEPSVAAAIRAMRHVHDDSAQRRSELIKKYNLENL